jgi:hypothetical protein
MKTDTDIYNCNLTSFSVKQRLLNSPVSLAWLKQNGFESVTPPIMKEDKNNTAKFVYSPKETFRTAVFGYLTCVEHNLLRHIVGCREGTG